MDEDRKLRRQQVLMLVVGGVSLAVVLIVGIDLVVNGGSGGRWWTVIGSSLTATAMVLGWFNLRSVRQKLRDANDARPTETL
ncbi:hypothetical protein [Microbacterium sp. W4I20]|uniref:hypothetical protein n=1 Tax=Microbacterium sp. W4I20 TaxID=3042262 RepID=UPI0027D8D4D4|nr:hypothetical protein [Microbacterium sp. W4I20]